MRKGVTSAVESEGEGGKEICDIRYSINYWPNSVTAAEYAAGELGAKRILFEALYCPASDDDDEDCFLLVPPMSPEYELLKHTPWSNWYYDFVINKQFSIPDVFDEITAVKGVEAYWVWLKAGEAFFEEAAQKLRDLVPEEVELVLVDSLPIVGALPQGVRGCDPTGGLDYRLLERPEVLSEDAALMASKPAIIPNTFSLDGHPAAQYKAIPIP